MILSENLVASCPPSPWEYRQVESLQKASCTGLPVSMSNATNKARCTSLRSFQPPFFSDPDRVPGEWDILGNRPYKLSVCLNFYVLRCCDDILTNKAKGGVGFSWCFINLFVPWQFRVHMNTQELDARVFRDTGVMEFILIGSFVLLSKHDVITRLWMEFHIPLALPFL